MFRAVLLVCACLPLAATAQSVGCVEVPRGAPMDITVVVPTPRGANPGAPRARAMVVMPGVPSHGHDCLATEAPAGDTLRGPPAPNILHGPRGPDILREPQGPDISRDPPPPRSRVTITPR